MENAMKALIQTPRRRISSRPDRAFTLMELLVTITIIAILLGIAIPAISSISRRVQISVAHQAATELKNSTGTYYTEYRRYPTRLAGPEDGDSPVLSDSTLMDVLLASTRETHPAGLCPHGNSFYTGRNAQPLGNGKYKSGIVYDSTGGGTLWDPWGGHYRLVFDLNYDGKVPAPSFVTGTPFLSGGVVVWSAGKDGLDDETKDNVVTW